MARMSGRDMADRIYTRFYGHLDDKGFHDAKLTEIYDWIGDSPIITLAQAIRDWAEYDAEDIARNVE